MTEAVGAKLLSSVTTPPSSPGLPSPPGVADVCSATWRAFSGLWSSQTAMPTSSAASSPPGSAARVAGPDAFDGVVRAAPYGPSFAHPAPRQPALTGATLLRAEGGVGVEPHFDSRGRVQKRGSKVQRVVSHFIRINLAFTVSLATMSEPWRIAAHVSDKGGAKCPLCSQEVYQSEQTLRTWGSILRHLQPCRHFVAIGHRRARF